MHITMPPAEVLRKQAQRFHEKAAAADLGPGTNGCASFLYGMAERFNSIADEVETEDFPAALMAALDDETHWEADKIRLYREEYDRREREYALHGPVRGIVSAAVILLAAIGIVLLAIKVIHFIGGVQ